MRNIVIDGGHSLIKYKMGKTEGDFPHALVPLTETEYEQIARRANGNPPDDYLVVQGKPYVMGERAELHGTLTRKSGAARYTREYYAVFVMACLLKAGAKSGEYAIFGSHPPADVDYRENLMGSVIGDWTVESGDKCFHYTIEYANAFDEPMGGFMHLMLTEDAQFYIHSELAEGRTLGIDIGGGTTDLFAVEPEGRIDYSLTTSIPIGLLQVMNQFERSFRAHYRDDVKDMLKLPTDRVRKAIATGKFRGGGREIDCSAEVKEATNLLLNKIADIYQNLAGGPLAWDHIYLTGGGPVPLYNHLLPILNHNHVLMAETEAYMHRANVRGGDKLWKFYVNQGVIEL